MERWANILDRKSLLGDVSQGPSSVFDLQFQVCSTRRRSKLPQTADVMQTLKRLDDVTTISQCITSEG